ncbi:MAG: phosphohistidine phosphatase SixA [Hahellaceae bacterium]|nr:phosphohistidine phosphatase SixA [Hahellaceae bacterium]
MIKVWLMRHGEASFGGKDDFSRELTQRGSFQSAQVINRLKAGGDHVDCVVASPLVRAQQTARIASDLLGVAVITFDGLKPESDPADFIDWAEKQHLNNCLIVTHMPFVGDLYSLAVRGNYLDSEPFGTSQLVGISADLWGAGCFSASGIILA